MRGVGNTRVGQRAKEGVHGGTMGSPVLTIGVPRFELGTSPTRTERATRLRHTPSSAHRLATLDTVRCGFHRYVVSIDNEEAAA
jgi:hypothetical protein